MQHDAQETISLLLDGLHEDLNRAKPQALSTEKTGWAAHLSRSQSVVVDLMHGFFESAVSCPNCHQIALGGEAFCVVPLPIPEKDSYLRFIAYYVPYGADKVPTRLDLELTKTETVDSFRKKAAAILGSKLEFEVCAAGAEMKARFSDSATAAELKAATSSTSQAVNVMLYEVPSGGHHAIRVPLVVGVENEATQSVDYITYARVLFFPQEATAEDAYAEIVEYFWGYIAQIRAVTTGEKSKETKEFVAGLMKAADGDGTGEAPRTPETVLAPYFTLNLVRGKGKKCLPYSAEIRLADLVVDSSARLEMVWSQKGRLIVSGSINQYKELPLEESKKPPAIAKHTTTLYDCLATFSAPEVLDEDNKWLCPHCKTHVKGTRITSIGVAPRILIVALKRFKSFASGMKNSELVDFPLSGLDLSKYMSSTAKVPTKYNLYAVCNHYGHLGGGHYTAFAKHAETGRWYLYDDTWVKQVKEEEVVSAAAYVLFYRREDVLPMEVDYDSIKQLPGP